MGDNDERKWYELEAEDRRLMERVVNIEKTLFANGRPSLEDRVRQYVDEKAKSAREHAENNAEEADGYAMKEIARVERETEKRHNENRDEFRRFRDQLRDDMAEDRKQMVALGKKVAGWSGGIVVGGIAVNILLRYIH